MSDLAIHTANLVKRYGKKRAVQDVSLNVPFACVLSAMTSRERTPGV